MSKNARAFRNTVGMPLQQFDFLMRGVEKAYAKAEQDWTGQTASAKSARADHSLCTCGGMVLLTLMCYRTYLTQDGMTHLFGITQGSICTNIKKMSPIIRDCPPIQ